MAALPEPINHTTSAILTAYELRAAAHGFGDSRGVPMSDAANECDRAIFYKLRWACPSEKIDGQKQSRFDTGHSWEKRLLDDLEMIGCTVERVDPATGRQFTVDLADGWLRGKMDATATGLPEAPKTVHVVECKSLNDRAFKELVKKKLQAGKPDHYLQCQLYCHAKSITRCLYYASNKNDDSRYAERVEYDAALCLRAESRIHNIVTSDRAPSRLHDDVTSKAAFACAWCPALQICHEGAFARVNCRTCIAASFESGANVRCTLLDKPLSYDEQQRGCSQHLYLPSLVNGKQIDADPARRQVTYRLPDGREWRDGEGRSPT